MRLKWTAQNGYCLCTCAVCSALKISQCQLLLTRRLAVYPKKCISYDRGRGLATPERAAYRPLSWPLNHIWLSIWIRLGMGNYCTEADVGDSCIMREFLYFALQQILLRWSNEGDVRALGGYIATIEKCIKHSCRKIWRRDSLEDAGADERIILKWDLVE